MRAIQRDPNEPLAHAYMAFLTGMLGDLETAKAEAARAIALDPCHCSFAPFR
jgi:Tfp pilus assembly protein PilF